MSVSNPSLNGTDEASNFNRGKIQMRLLAAAIVLALVAAVVLVWAEL